jgi:hypothetical protein
MLSSGFTVARRLSSCGSGYVTSMFQAMLDSKGCRLYGTWVGRDQISSPIGSAWGSPLGLLVTLQAIGWPDIPWLGRDKGGLIAAREVPVCRWLLV